jgi:alpha-L-rhamnosidase
MPEPLEWPRITRQCRPWTRWWWLGSAADEAELTRHLERFRAAGIGGVEVSPIYGVRGAEARSVPYLTPRWVELLAHTVREGQRLDVGVDTIMGTGWPCGGTWVSAPEAAARALFESYHVAAGGRVEAPIRGGAVPEAALLALMAYSAAGEVLDLTEKVDAARRLQWQAPAGEWALHALFQAGTGQQVKRAAPGGDGLVLDHFSGAAVQHYLTHFDAPLAALPAGTRLRGFFNDSFEVYGANWTADLLPQFARRHGYDLRQYLPALRGEGDPERVSRVRADYRQTIAELLLEAFVEPWTAWAHRQGGVTRNQAHGSPGNLLDLYAAVDIPETETFRNVWLEFAGLELPPGAVRREGGRALILCGKLASSAAHVAGRSLCSSESCTWLGEHGQVPLEHVKAVADCLFVMGINHVFFHGTPFSPADAAWPGWMFYATTHCAPTNPWWRDFAAVNAYIARCQSFLQSGRPDNDVLLYFPIHDLWSADAGSRNLLQYLAVHNTGQWLDENLAVFARTGERLWERGYGFDCVSDRLLAEAITVSGQGLQSRGGAYRVLLIAGCTHMPPETLERILRLAQDGATVLVAGAHPSDVPGLGDLEQRRARLRTAREAMGTFRTVRPGVTESRVGAGRVLIGDDPEALLEHAGVRREAAVDDGIALIRRREGDGWCYFLVNQGRQRLERWVTLGVPAQSVALFDPANERRGVARVRQSAEGGSEVFLQLEPGQSLIMRALPHAVEGAPWPYLTPAGAATALAGEWQVQFVTGGPALPSPTRVTALTSWTTWAGDIEALRAFSGTARYTITFDRPAAAAAAWALDLGDVRDSARIRLNGEELGTLYARPWHLPLPQTLRARGNELEIEVTNLMANRLAALDRRKVDWRKFYFVNIDYRPFDASTWEPLPSGLLGPVRLVPLRELVPGG